MHCRNRFNCLFEFCGQTDSNANSDAYACDNSKANSDAYGHAGADRNARTNSNPRSGGILPASGKLRSDIVEHEFARKRTGSVKGALPQRSRRSKDHSLFAAKRIQRAYPTRRYACLVQLHQRRKSGPLPLISSRFFAQAPSQFDPSNLRRACLITSVLLLGGLLTGCREGISREVLATVLSTRGEVVNSSKGSTNFRPVSAEAKLSVGSILRASSGARIDLVLIPGALAQISGDSELNIEGLRLTKDGNETGDAMRERIAHVELRHGALVVFFEGSARFTIKTADATVTVLPSCLFKLDVDGSRTRLTCVRGKLEVNPKSSQMVAVEAGYFREWPSAQGNAPATENRQAELDTTQTLQVARELQELETARRDHLPF